MTAAKTAAPYTSGMCVHARHDRCRGQWGLTVCDCPCHSEDDGPEPEPEAVLPLLLARHCPSCACEGHG